MKRLVLLLLFIMAAAWQPASAAADAANGPATIPPPGAASGSAQQPNPAPSENSHPTSDEELKREAAAATVLAHRPAVAAATGLIERIVDSVLGLFDVDENGNALAHYGVAAVFLLLALLLRRVITAVILNRLRKVAARTRTGLRDKLLPVLETPTSALVGLFGVFCALNALKLSELARSYVDLAATLSFSLVIFWGLLRAFDALLDHLQGVARDRQLDIA